MYTFLICYFYYVGKVAFEKVKQKNLQGKMGLGHIKFAFIFMILWTIVSELLVVVLFTGIGNFEILMTLSGITGFGGWIAFGCWLYSLYFVSKNLAILEFNTTEVSNKLYSNFFLYFFFPIGIWFVQPKVNTLLSTNEPKKATPEL
ncbi:hypothetical protein KGV52_01710 [Candidatus Gracilibacteria bacterium]|nr:hypothetical protein [Candidatus Gracilibacteria bacterium]